MDTMERSRILRRLIPGSQLRIIPDAGHLVIEDRPDGLIRQIRPFQKG